MFYRLTATLPVVLVILSTLVAPSFQHVVTYSSLLTTVQLGRWFPVLACLMSYSWRIIYHGNSGIECTWGGIDYGFAGQLTATCASVNPVGLIPLLMQHFFLTFRMGNSLRGLVLLARGPSGPRDLCKNYISNMFSVASLQFEYPLI